MTGPARMPLREAKPGLRAEPAWSAQILAADDAFASLEDEWEDLYARCRSATPFQCHAWLESWWREYGVPGRLRLVLARRDGQLVGAAPLWLAWRGPWRVLLPLGGDQSDYHDILLDPAWTGETAHRLAAALLAGRGWDVLDVPEVRSGAGVERLYEAWPGARWRSLGARCLELRAGSMPEFVGGLPAHTAKTVKRKLRRVEAAPIDAKQTVAAEVPEAVRALLGLHAGQWKRRGIDAEHIRPRYERHLSRALAAMVERGQAELTQYRIDGRVVVADLEMVGRDFVGTYLAGFEPGMREHVDVAILMLSRVFVLTERLGVPVVSLLRGDEAYKMHWRPVPARNQRLLLARPGMVPTAAAYAGLVRARRAAADAARERAPWLRSARNRVRSAAGLARRGA